MMDNFIKKTSNEMMAMTLKCWYVPHHWLCKVGGFWQELKQVVTYADPNHPKHAQYMLHNTHQICSLVNLKIQNYFVSIFHYAAVASWFRFGYYVLIPDVFHACFHTNYVSLPNCCCLLSP